MEQPVHRHVVLLVRTIGIAQIRAHAAAEKQRIGNGWLLGFDIGETIHPALFAFEAFIPVVQALEQPAVQKRNIFKQARQFIRGLEQILMAETGMVHVVIVFALVASAIPEFALVQRHAQGRKEQILQNGFVVASIREVVRLELLQDAGCGGFLEQMAGDQSLLPCEPAEHDPRQQADQGGPVPHVGSSIHGETSPFGRPERTNPGFGDRTGRSARQCPAPAATPRAGL